MTREIQKRDLDTGKRGSGGLTGASDGISLGSEIFKQGDFNQALHLPFLTFLRAFSSLIDPIQ